MRTALIALVALNVFFASPVLAQSGGGGQPVRIVGTVDKLEGQTLRLTSSQGAKQAVTLAADANVSTNIKKKLSDLQVGDYIGATTTVDKSGNHRASEIRIFAKDRVPSNLAQFPLAYAPDNIMTNAQVVRVESAGPESIVVVKYPAGEARIGVGPDTVILATGAGDVSLLKPGARVTFTATKAADGSLSSRRIAVD